MTHFVLCTFSGYINDFPVNNHPGTENYYTSIKRLIMEESPAKPVKYSDNPRSGRNRKAASECASKHLFMRKLIFM